MKRMINVVMLVMVVLSMAACGEVAEAVNKELGNDPQATPAALDPDAMGQVLTENEQLKATNAALAALITPTAGAMEVTEAATEAPSATAQPSATPTFAPTATPSAVAGCMDWASFKSATAGMDNAYVMIDWLDKQSLKVDHPQGGFTVTNAPNTATVLWTGLYVQDTTLAGAVKPYLVDGKTGVWVVTAVNVTIPTPGGTMCVSGYDGSTMGESTNQDTGLTVSATTCVDTKQVVDIINAWKQINSNQIYVELDRLVDNNPTARLRASGSATVIVKNVQTLLWVLDGNAIGDVLALDTTESKTLYVATKDGQIKMTHAFSGVSLCSPMDPAKDFPWWGK